MPSPKDAISACLPTASLVPPVRRLLCRCFLLAAIVIVVVALLVVVLLLIVVSVIVVAVASRSCLHCFVYIIWRFLHSCLRMATARYPCSLRLLPIVGRVYRAVKLPTLSDPSLYIAPVPMLLLSPLCL